MLHRLLGVFSLASLLVAQTPCGAPAIAQTVPSASPLAAPSASAAPPYRDPDLHPATAASRAWILQLRRTAYVAASGHRLLFGSALAPLMRFSASQPIGDYEPGIVRDRRRGLLKICFVFAPCRSDSSMYAVVREASTSRRSA
jgi:hypothetical protein